MSEGEDSRLPPGATSRPIRSYHQAFSGELLLYSFGKDFRLWRPIPARGFIWVVALGAAMLLLTKTLGVHPQMWTIPWGITYLVFPGGLGWLLTVGKIEGRRIHVAAGAWLRHAGQGRDLVGGYRKTVVPLRVRNGKIRVHQDLPKPRRRRRG